MLRETHSLLSSPTASVKYSFSWNEQSQSFRDSMLWPFDCDSEIRLISDLTKKKKKKLKKGKVTHRPFCPSVRKILSLQAGRNGE